MNAGIDHLLRKAYFISPIVDMEKLITDMMHGSISAMYEITPSTGWCQQRSSMGAVTT